MDSVNQKYFDKFSDLEAEYDECSELLASVEIMSDNKLFEHYRKLKQKNENVVLSFKKYKQTIDEAKFVKELFDSESNPDERNNLLLQMQELEEKSNNIFEETKKIFFENGSKENQKAKVEISHKTGDKEFVLEINNVIENFANKMNFKIEVVSKTDSQISVFVEGENAFELLKLFQGTVRKIQNTNETNVLVVVLLDEKQEFELREEDVAIEISKSSGAGGQHINKTESAVKLIHLPTGISAECQDERSQGKNKEKAMAALKEKILQKIKENNQKNIKNQRNSLKNAIFSDTAVLIFDYDRNKVVDNRTKKNYSLKDILGGNLNLISGDLSI